MKRVAGDFPLSAFERFHILIYIAPQSFGCDNASEWNVVPGEFQRRVKRLIDARRAG